MSYFLPSDSLVRTWQTTIQVLAIIAGFIAVMAAGTLALHMVICFCGGLVAFIHSFSEVCQTTFNAVNGNYVGVVVTFIVWLMLLLSIKVTCVLLPSIMSSFRIQGVRV